jgi:cytochrome c biogenesis protein
MSDSIRTGALKAAQDPLDDLDGQGLSLQVTDVFDRLWHLFISMRTGLALILVLAVLSLIGTLLAQAPAGLRSDPQAYADWLTSLQPKYGGWTGILDKLGFFSIFSSIWFRGTTVLLATSILACSINRAPRLWKQAVHPRIVTSSGFFDHATLTGSAQVEAGSDDAVGALQKQLRRRGYRTIVATDEGGAAVYADRFRWGPFGTVIAHLSLIFILAGAILGGTGFRTTDFAIAVGSTAPVGNGTNLSVKAASFTDSYYDNGSPSDYASHLVLYDKGQQVAEQTIRVNDPLRYGDVTFFQSFYGPAADIVVRDSTGAAIFQDGVPLLYASTDGSKSIGQFDIPSQGLTVYVIGAASGKVDPTIKAGQMQIEVYQTPAGNTPLGTQVVDQGTPATIGGLSFTFARERQFTGLIVSRDPGAPLIWLGAIFLVLGVMLVFFFPSRRIWARVRAGRTGSLIQVAAVSRHDVSFETSFGTLIEDVRLALPGGTAA